MGHKKKEKLLFYIKVEYMCDGHLMVPFQKIEIKKMGKLKRNIPKINIGKLIKTEGSTLLFVTCFLGSWSARRSKLRVNSLRYIRKTHQCWV